MSSFRIRVIFEIVVNSIVVFCNFPTIQVRLIIKVDLFSGFYGILFVLERKAVKMYGCTTPYGPHKDQICKNKENGTKVFDKYVETIDGHKYDCKNPCKYIISRPFITSDLSNQPNINGQKVAYFKIYFKRNIKFTRAHYLYSELSLIAEIGGYVGLFLGVSVNQITMLMDIAFGWFDTFCNSKHLN